MDGLWDRIRQQSAGWCIYAIGTPVPQQPASKSELHHFVQEVDELLRTQHEENYCGIVYADDLIAPTMIKIYDPRILS